MSDYQFWVLLGVIVTAAFFLHGKLDSIIERLDQISDAQDETSLGSNDFNDE